MKLITLNVWGGYVRDPLLAFTKAHRQVDIFCLQEVYHRAHEKISTEERLVTLDIFDKIQALLPDHQAFFRPTVDQMYGIAMLVHKSIEVVREGEISIYQNPDYLGRGPAHSRILQWVECRHNGVNFGVLNVHGLWNGRGKTDTPERIAQSQSIRAFMDTLKMPQILCGDFNLRPDSESLHILEKGMTNWITKHRIQSTRTSYYTKPERFADYIFTSPDIPVTHFEVMPEEVSDHSALLLEFKI